MAFYNDQGWIEIQYENQNNQIYVYKSKKISVTNGIQVMAEEPVPSEYLPLGNTYTMKYTISGGSGKRKAVPGWSVSINGTHYNQKGDETNESIIYATYSPTEQVEAFDYYLRVTDENGAMFFANKGHLIPVARDELWDVPTYRWKDDYSEVYASRYYNKQDYNGMYTYDCEVKETVKTKATIKPASEKSKGKITYIAQFTNPVFSTQKKVIYIPKLLAVEKEGFKYLLNPYDKTATVKGITNKNVKKIVIPDKIKDKGKTYIVSVIGSKAFSGLKKLEEVVIGKNIKQIEAKAFYKCKKLSTITIKTKKIKSGSIGPDAFKNIYKKAKFLFPKGKAKVYKQIFIKAGAPKKGSYK